MTLTLELPDELARDLHLDGPGSNRRALEMLVLEGYRSLQISRRGVGRLLNLNFVETEQFLHDHNAMIEMTIEEYEEDMQEIRRTLGR